MTWLSGDGELFSTWPSILAVSFLGLGLFTCVKDQAREEGGAGRTPHTEPSNSGPWNPFPQAGLGDNGLARGRATGFTR